MPPTEPLLLTIEQVGDLLGVSYDSAYREVTGGRFGAYDKLPKFGRSRRVPRHLVLAAVRGEEGEAS